MRIDKRGAVSRTSIRTSSLYCKVKECPVKNSSSKRKAQAVYNSCCAAVRWRSHIGIIMHLTDRQNFRQSPYPYHPQQAFYGDTYFVTHLISNSVLHKCFTRQPVL